MEDRKSKFKYKYVLLLDDNDLDNFINRKIIESVDFADKIHVNSSGESALEFLNTFPNSSNAFEFFPEVIFVDLNMPSMDGFQFINKLKENIISDFKKLKVVILTSSVYEGDRKKAGEISKDIVFLNKPLTVSMLDEL